MAHLQTTHIEEGHGSFAGYMAGFVLSVALTAAAFWLVIQGVLPSATALPVIAGLAAVQVIVHLVFFLHMNGSSGQGWNMLAFAYTVICSLILIVGTVWVMHNVSMNMMSR
jgi:cytochrome o ubiquinol oxidase operon protein cyoD